MQIRNYTPTHMAKFSTNSCALPATSAPSSKSPEASDGASSSVATRSVTKDVLLGGAAFMPGLGLAANIYLSVESAMSDYAAGKSTWHPTSGRVGALANCAGSILGAYGYSTGNQLMTWAGAGLLGLSGLAAMAVLRDR